MSVALVPAIAKWQHRAAPGPASRLCPSRPQRPVWCRMVDDRDRGRRRPTRLLAGARSAGYWGMRMVVVVTALLAAACTTSSPVEEHSTASAPAEGSRQPTAPGTVDQACPVTAPNNLTPPGEAPSKGSLGAGGYLGNGRLWTVLWPHGLVLVPPDDIGPDGSLEMKFPWWRGPRLHGAVHIHGHELALGLPVGASIPGGYGDTGFQPSGIVFPAAGCYEITGEAAGATLTFVTLVRPCSALAGLPPSQRRSYAICQP
jgi:hypothetical protein